MLLLEVVVVILVLGTDDELYLRELMHQKLSLVEVVH